MVDLKATEYITGPSAKEYIGDSEHLFKANKIQLTYKTYPEYPVYRQLRLPFENNVSILDLIANIHVDEIRKYIWKH